MSGIDLKQARIKNINFDIERPITFDFNTLATLQELGYDNPYIVIAEFERGRLTAMKTLIYACLESGANAKNIVIDLNINEVGIILGNLMQYQEAQFKKVFQTIGECVKEFFPKKEDNKEAEEDSDSKN